MAIVNAAKLREVLEENLAHSETEDSPFSMLVTQSVQSNAEVDKSEYP